MTFRRFATPRRSIDLRFKKNARRPPPLADDRAEFDARDIAPRVNPISDDLVREDGEVI